MRKIQRQLVIQLSRMDSLGIVPGFFFFFFLIFIWASLVAQAVKRLFAMLAALGQEDPLEKEMATHSSTFAWKIPRTEEPGRLQSMGSPQFGCARSWWHVGSSIFPAAHRIFSCSMQDLVPRPGLKPGLPAL